MYEYELPQCWIIQGPWYITAISSVRVEILSKQAFSLKRGTLNSVIYDIKDKKIGLHLSKWKLGYFSLKIIRQFVFLIVN